MIRRKIRFDTKEEPGAEELEDKKTRAIKKVAIAVAFLSTYYFFVKLLFL